MHRRNLGEAGRNGQRLRWMLLLVVGLALAAMPAKADDAVASTVTEDIKSLGSKNIRERRDAAQALGNLAAAAQPSIRTEVARAIPALLRTLKDSNADVRMTSAFALGNIASNPASTLPALVEALRDKVADVRRSAARALGEFGKTGEPAVPALIAAAHDLDGGVRQEAIRALGEIGAQPDLVVPELVAALRDPNFDVGRSGVVALGEFGIEAQRALPALISLLRDPEYLRRWFAAEVLGDLSPAIGSAEPALNLALSDSSALVRVEAATVLAKTGLDLAAVTPVLLHLLGDENAGIRGRAAFALRYLAAVAQPPVAPLVRALGDPEGDVRQYAARSLAQLGADLARAGRTDTVDALREATAAVERDPGRSRQVAAALREAVETLETVRSNDWRGRAIDAAHAQPLITAFAAAYFALAILWTVLHRLAPLAILHVNEVLKPLPKLRVPGWLGGFEASVADLFLVGFLHYRDRELDAWVAQNAMALRARLGPPEPWRGRQEPIVTLEGRRLAALEPADLKPFVARTRFCLQIVGATSAVRHGTVHRIAHWAVEPERSMRLGDHLMLPVLIETGFVADPAKGADPFVRAAREALSSDTTVPSEALVLHLLQRQRILLVIECFSMLADATRAAIRPDDPDFPARALVVTAEREEELASALKRVIRLEAPKAGAEAAIAAAERR